MREELRATGWITYWWVIVLALLLATSVVGYTVKPYFVRQDTRIIRQSNGYVTAHQQALETMRADYDGLATRLAEIGGGNPQLADALRSQQAGLRRQMQAEAALIPDDVPGDAREHADHLADPGRPGDEIWLALRDMARGRVAPTWSAWSERPVRDEPGIEFSERSRAELGKA
jgi:Tfp pilus assembly protein PilN